MGSGGHTDVAFLDFGSKKAWNHKFRWSILPTISRYSMPLAFISGCHLQILTEYSKLAVHLWTNNLAKRLKADNSKVIVLVVQPGPILSVSHLGLV